MIIELDFAEDLLQEIENNLYQFQEEQGINKSNHLLRVGDFDFMYKNDNFRLPIFSRNSTEIIQISKSHFQIYFNAIKDEHPLLIKNGLEKTICDEFESCDPANDIYIAISDSINNLTLNYNEVLKITRDRDILFGIKDEEKILINHLNKYQDILKSKLLQLEFFNGIVLNKNISDLITKIYIRFIKLRLGVINPVIKDGESITPDRPFEFQKLIWNGNQNQLCELIVELQKKGWINTIKQGTLRSTSKTLTTLFDLSKSQNKPNSNKDESFYQVMKGEKDAISGERNYENIFTKNYDRKFHNIKNKG